MGVTGLLTAVKWCDCGVRDLRGQRFLLLLPHALLLCDDKELNRKAARGEETKPLHAPLQRSLAQIPLEAA
jgi:hypothetical protein